MSLSNQYQNLRETLNRQLLELAIITQDTSLTLAKLFKTDYLNGLQQAVNKDQTFNDQHEIFYVLRDVMKYLLRGKYYMQQAVIENDSIAGTHNAMNEHLLCHRCKKEWFDDVTDGGILLCDTCFEIIL